MKVGVPCPAPPTVIHVPPEPLDPQDAVKVLVRPSQQPLPPWSWICVTFVPMLKASTAWPLKAAKGRSTSGSLSAVSRTALPVQPAGAPPA